MGIADRTTLNNLSPNLQPNQVAASGLRLATFQYLFNLSDANYNEFVLYKSGALAILDGGSFTDSITDAAVDGGTFL
jgi:hypothetical protein